MAASICAGFLDHARRAPDRPAIRHTGHTTTYGELAALAATLAAGLRERGIGEGDRVALALAPGPDLVAAMIAVAATGAASVPLDHRDGSRRLADIVIAGRCRLVLVDQGSPHPAWWGRPVAAPVPVEDLKRPAAAPEPADLAPGRPAALSVIFTSGTNGRPNGVVTPHEAVATLVTTVTAQLALADGLVWSVRHPPEGAMFAWGIWGALLSGGTLAIPAPGGGRALSEFVAREKVGVWSLTPTAFARAIANPARIARVARAGHLRHVVLGGEPLPSAVVRPWVEAGGPNLVHVYGVTEATGASTLHVVTLDSLARPHVPIGVALPGRTVTVHDAAGAPAPAGAVGELWIGGDPVRLSHFVRAELPAYMRPARLVPIERIPVTTGGELDVAALPDPWPPRGGQRDAVRLTASVRQAFADVLGHPAVCDLSGLARLARDVVDLCRGTADPGALAERGRRHLDVLRAGPGLEFADGVPLRDSALMADGTLTNRIHYRPSDLIVEAAGGTGPVGERSVTVAPEVHTAAVDLARAAGVPVKSVYVAAHLETVSRWDGRSCVSISARPDLPEAGTCVGYFANPRAVSGGRGYKGVEQVRDVWAGERWELASRHASLDAQLVSRWADPAPPVLIHYTDLHLLREVGGAVLRARGGGGQPLIVDVDATAPQAVTITVRGTASRLLDRVAAEHLSALAGLVA